MRQTGPQSDRFWRVETMGKDLMVNWGKVGTAGRYEVQTFESEEACLAQASALVKSKEEAGYGEYDGFDPNFVYYYDDTKVGIHPLTSHPNFRSHFGSPMYYTSTDDRAPFGSDEGSDALWELTDHLRRRPRADLDNYPSSLLRKLYKLPYHPPKGESVKELQMRGEDIIAGEPALHQLKRTDMLLISLALSQVKITGNLAPSLYHLAQGSIERLLSMKQLGVPIQSTEEILAEERGDLESYWESRILEN